MKYERCCCRFESDGQTSITQCSFHSIIETERDRYKAAIKEHKADFIDFNAATQADVDLWATLEQGEQG